MATKRLPFRAGALDVFLDAGHAEGAGRLEDRAGVLEDVLDGGADLVGVYEHHFIHRFAAQAEGLAAHAFHRDTVGKQPHLLEGDPFPGGEGLLHGGGVDRLHADDLDVREEMFDVGRDTADESAPAHGTKMASMGLRYWRRISTAMVPCPAITSGSSYG
jgi:hypothetical protein